MGDYGFIRIAACIPEVKVGRPAGNAAEIVRQAKSAAAEGARIICFPELCLTGCTLGDLTVSRLILKESLNALSYIRDHSSDTGIIINAGLPIEYNGNIYDATATIADGRIFGITLHSNPADKRHFSQAGHICGTARICGDETAISDCPIFKLADATFAIQPAGLASNTGADIILHPSCYPEIAGRTAELRTMVRQRSADSISAIVLTSAGNGESTTDNLFAGHAIIAEDGEIICEKHFENGTLIADIDIELLRNRRPDNRMATAGNIIDITGIPQTDSGDDILYRTVSPNPFQYCDEVFADTFRIQTGGLATRLRQTGISRVVIGISGGLDSTLALLVCVKVFDRMGLDRKLITGITMPGFGTTGRTYTNAVGMMRSLGIDWREISIREASLLHLKDIGHDIDIHDSAYENTQARERTQILMDVANGIGAVVVGTGDLSELAIGWCTYNGDHMSMYAVNAGVPKTLIPGIIRYAAESEQFSAAKANLLDVIDTPITPELLPSDSNGRIVQKTEDIIGPYELHDFFLYHTVKNGFTPAKILYLAIHAFDGKYEETVIRKWLTLFLKRFFTNQFKRSCMPDGPATGPVSLSPRGGWQMPSDISSAAWLESLG
ncbi:MAG: NAD(+) synthase [Bacteroidaceae bacterium]|nr:NAD(+) synthase [Bacteroidaceae bacterium]